MEKRLSKNNKTTTWITKVVQENGDLVMLFPPELLEELKLVENEFLRWTVSENGDVQITRTKVIA
jgi:hypothetical protein